MLPVFKPTVELKICGYLPQSSIRGLELDPEPLLIPSNQLNNKTTLSYGTVTLHSASVPF